MAGTLTISTLSDGTNSTSSTNCIQGSAKAWVNYSLTTQTVKASYNVSSVTYNGTSVVTINFTNAFTDTNYAIAGFARSDGTGTANNYVVSATSTATKTTSALQVYSWYNGGTFNSPEIGVVCFR
jgi:hypothetical protein